MCALSCWLLSCHMLVRLIRAVAGLFVSYCRIVFFHCMRLSHLIWPFPIGGYFWVMMNKAVGEPAGTSLPPACPAPEPTSHPLCCAVRAPRRRHCVYAHIFPFPCLTPLSSTPPPSKNRKPPGPSLPEFLFLLLPLYSPCSLLWRLP